MIKIKEIDYGIACRIGNDIYMNKNLMEYPRLYCAILNHELLHSPGFTLNDIFMDLHNNHLKGLKREYYSFILRNPRALVEFLPGWWYDKSFIINPSILLVYGAILALFGGLLLLF